MRKAQYDQANKIPIVGDSHILSMAWHRIHRTLPDDREISYILDPKLVTGLMVWHIAREKTDCLPWANLEQVLGTVRKNANKSQKKTK